MLIPPQYVLTSKISQLLSSIESSKEVINSVQIPLEVEQNFRRSSTLKSSLFSARIEGNPYTLEEIHKVPSKNQKKIEVFNILKALNWIYDRRFKDLTSKDILYLHQQSMNGLIEKAEVGKLRNNMEAIFNAAGIAIYLPPSPGQVSPLLNRLLTYINSNKEPLIPVKAVIAHYIFEKIHPFLDGNGRVGRLLLQAVLQREGYGMKGLLALEEHLDNHRSDYYRSLEEVERDITDYIEFMLEAIADGASIAKEQVLKKENLQIEDYLLPRRAEILEIIKDHQLITFDQLRRRFLAINPRTLRYDLKKLQDAHLIRKRGTTKGVFYEPQSNTN